jgi:hypothetical protein
MLLSLWHKCRHLYRYVYMQALNKVPKKKQYIHIHMYIIHTYIHIYIKLAYRQAIQCRNFVAGFTHMSTLVHAFFHVARGVIQRLRCFEVVRHLRYCDLATGALCSLLHKNHVSMCACTYMYWCVY